MTDDCPKCGVPEKFSSFQVRESNFLGRDEGVGVEQEDVMAHVEEDFAPVVAGQE